MRYASGKLRAKATSEIIMLFSLGVALACAFLLLGCSPSQEEPAQNAANVVPRQQSVEPLKVGVQYNALSIPTVFADDNGFFIDAGVEVELYTYANGAEENKALEKGDVDIASDGLASVYMLATGQFSWIGESDNGSSTVGVYMRQGTAPTLLSGQVAENPDIKGSADTLRGLRVVGPAGTMEEWAAISYFSQFGLNAVEDFEFVEMDRADAAQSVIDGAADVFVATDVDYCRVMEENGFEAVATGAEATLVPFNNGYIVSNKVLEDRYDDLVLFLRSVYKASETLAKNPEVWANFAYEYYKANGKPATLEDVQLETRARQLILPADLVDPTYKLGSGVLDIGAFNAKIGALEEDQVQAIENSINTKVLQDAFGMQIAPATLSSDQ